MRLALVVTVVGMLGVGVAVGCAGRDDDLSSAAISDAAVVEYRFSDASVPPEHHRSYTLAITAGEVRIVVDSYGDVLHDVTRSLPAEAWGRVRADVARLPAAAEDDVDDGCTGGTGRALRVRDADRVVVDLEAEACGGEGAARVDALDAVVQPVIAAVPDWDVLVAEGS